ncbi:MAG: hypothetical protein RBS14_00055 [Atribacterota bacterium]|jgi:hypothetical protein|nr:hypothetical protein [Atribacterota bacterium]
MDILPKASPAQSLLLRTAARRTDGRRFPDILRGGALAKVLTDAAFAAIGQQRSVPPDDFVVDGCRPVSNPVGHPLNQVAYDKSC